jgi:hypothetical protein
MKRDVIFNNILGARFASTWWKDICAIEDFVEGKKWLAESIRRRLNNGASMLFWSHQWIGNATLAVKFPRLFSLSLQREGVVRDMYEVNGDNLQWSFNWRRRLFSWEEDQVSQLQVLLDQVRVTEEVDCWWWYPDPEGAFSVKSFYSLLFKELLDEVEIDWSM